MRIPGVVGGELSRRDHRVGDQALAWPKASRARTRKNHQVFSAILVKVCSVAVIQPELPLGDRKRKSLSYSIQY